MKPEELKLCPFCGGKAELIKQGHREYKPTFYIQCTNFGCEMATPQKTNAEEAVLVWNRRK